MYGLVGDNDDTDALSDQEIVAKTLFGEASNQGYEGQQAVANVIQNRVASPGWWGNDFRTVCLKPYQFSCWIVSDPNRARIMAASEADPIYAQCMSIAALAIAGQLIDITNGADSYLVTGTPAKWSDGLVPVAVIGAHSFYKTAINQSS
jgi:spore germination cell wall hydrolase CwlJ-like protein